MQDMRIDGIGKIPGGSFGRLVIDGVGECTGPLDADTLKIDGTFKCAGDVRVKELDCDGSARFDRDIHAGRLVVDGLLTMMNRSKLEADEVICDGSISMDGQICADILRADGLIRAREIVGDRIVIKSYITGLAKLFTKGSSKIELIEATYVELSGVTAQTVNGSHIVVGPKCHIETLDCNGTLSIHPSATVQRITGVYTMQNL